MGDIVTCQIMAEGPISLCSINRFLESLRKPTVPFLGSNWGCLWLVVLPRYSVQFEDVDVRAVSR